MKTALTIPVRRMKPLDGYFSWPERPILASARTDDSIPLKQLANTLRRRTKQQPKITRNAWGPASLRAHRDSTVSHAEGYRVMITQGGVEIFAATSAGIYYACQTLIELVHIHGPRLPSCRIDDRPDFIRRAIYVDASRGKVPTLQTLKDLVEHLAHWKINELQVYVENVFMFQQHPKIGRGFSPFSPEALLEVQEHCKSHHIRFVPSLTSFGHFERILALPAYAHLGELPGHNELPGGTTLCPGDPGSIKLVEEMYNEYLPLFEATDFNACCDETWELGKGRSKNRAARIGEGQVYLKFVKKLHRLCQKHGKRMNIWADIVLNHPDLLKDIPSDIVMLNWDYEPNGSRIPQTNKFERAGMSFLVCPGTNDWQSHGTRLATAMGNVQAFSARARRHQAEGILMTEWGDAGHRNTLGINMHGYAHSAAHAWNGNAVNDKEFTNTFCRHFFVRNHDRLAKALQDLGSTESRVGFGIPYHAWSQGLDPRSNFFRGIKSISPVWIPTKRRKNHIHAASSKGCHEVIARLRNANTWRKHATEMDPFAALTLEDLILGAQMDVLSCRRILLGKAISTGNSVSTKEFRKLASQTNQLRRDFEKNWLRRNEPSRLRDNLILFDHAEKECERLASM